jgi:hypothetical protein
MELIKSCIKRSTREVKEFNQTKSARDKAFLQSKPHSSVLIATQLRFNVTFFAHMIDNSTFEQFLPNDVDVCNQNTSLLQLTFLRLVSGAYD